MLNFVKTKRVDPDEVTQTSIVKKLELSIDSEKQKYFFLGNNEDNVFFI